MDIEYCRYFIKIYENKFNITKTSEQLSFSQPGLSKIVHNIEDELGVKLFTKEKGKYNDLTPAGELFLSFSKNVIALHQQLNDKLNSYKEFVGNTVKVGISPTILDFLFANHIKDFNNCSGSKVEFVEAYGNELLNKFARKEFDVLVTLYDEALAENHSRHELLSSNYMAVVNEKHPLAKLASLNWKDLSEYKIAIPSKGDLAYKQIKKLLAEKMIYPKHIYAVSRINMLLNLAANDDYVTILPKILFQNRPAFNNLSAITLTEHLTWNLCLYTQEKIDGSTQRIVEAIGSVSQTFR